MIRILLISGGTISLAAGPYRDFHSGAAHNALCDSLCRTVCQKLPDSLQQDNDQPDNLRYMTREAGRKAGISALVIMWSMIVLRQYLSLTATWLRILLIARQELPERCSNQVLFQEKQ